MIFNMIFFGQKIPREENKRNIFYGALFVEFARMKR